MKKPVIAIVSAFSLLAAVPVLPRGAANYFASTQMIAERAAKAPSVQLARDGGENEHDDGNQQFARNGGENEHDDRNQQFARNGGENEHDDRSAQFA